MSPAPFGAPQNNANAAGALQTTAPAAEPTRDTAEAVTVTGSILRNPNLSGANPVTHLTATDLAGNFTRVPSQPLSVAGG